MEGREKEDPKGGRGGFHGKCKHHFTQIIKTGAVQKNSVTLRQYREAEAAGLLSNVDISSDNNPPVECFNSSKAAS